MNETPTAQKPSGKRVLLSMLLLAFLTGVVIYVFKDHWAEITAALLQLKAWQVALVLAVGITYPLLEGVVCWLIIGSRLPNFKLWQAIDTSWMGVFGNVAALGVGAVPMQTYYIYRCGLAVGPCVGLMTLEYVFHKITVLLYATVMLLLQHRWLAANTTGVLNYLPLAYFVVAFVIVGLVLLCVSELAQRLARRLLDHLPKTEKWQARRAEWLTQLDSLAKESRLLLANRPLCVKILALQAFKLFLLFTLPYLCIRFMGLGSLSFMQVQLLASLTMFLSNAMPNVSGMGSVETAFLLVFSGFLGQAGAMSALMLYRIANYYFVFACSIVGFIVAERHLEKMG